ncbi:hypothetical protein AAFC00_003066 [Neodothiora populina]|uniref:Fatty acid hydroxylase domain-containing protein n=1 Tax=Neodothiora populina TaxID=2781224 RepID=A0ABR3PAI5_9PEZI
MSNSTLPPLPTYSLWPLPPVVSWIPDKYLTLVLPIVAYWALSLLFHWIDELDLFPQYRLHTPAEVLKRNHATRWEVFRDVIFQQVIQTAFGVVLGYLEEDAVTGKDDYNVAVWARRLRLAQRGLPGALAMVGVDSTGISKNLALAHPVLSSVFAGGDYGLYQPSVSGDIVPAFASWEIQVAKFIYWFAFPAMQFVFGVLVVDTWQYFWHRAMHMNKFLYTTFHSRHHRLYVPYAYGALYNHPFEGFLLDTLGTGLAYLLAGMTCRQSMWFFTCSTIKTVDDHCGYALPWDPLQHITSNNAGYHDIHHQSWGIKTNFSQPFFTFWDRLLGTMWIGGDVSARYERARLAAQRKVDADTISHTNVEDSLAAADDTAPYQIEAQNASSLAKTAQASLQPSIPAGKAEQQALGSRQQVLDDKVSGGISVLVEEDAEEAEAQRVLRRSPRKKTLTSSSNNSSTTTAAGLKGLRDRMNGSLHGKASGVLGVESSR